MNHESKLNRPSRQAAVFLGLFLVLPLLNAQPVTNVPDVPATNHSSEERVLVIVESSAAMQKRWENTQKIISNGVASGLGGRLQAGDTIGLWTFDTELHAGRFPLQRWMPQTRQKVALAMVQFLQQQKTGKAGKPAVIWEMLTNVIAHSERITVLLITDGSQPLVGSPYDAMIAESFKQNLEQQRKQNMPFVTILRGFNGKFVGAKVNTPPWPYEFPEFPEERTQPVAVAPAATTSAPAPAPLPRLPQSSIVYASASDLTNEPPEPVPATNPIPAMVTPNPPVPLPAVVVQTNAPVTGQLSDKPVVTNPSPVKEAEPPKQAAATSETIPPQKQLPTVTILVAGIALLVGVLVVFIAVMRWSRRSSRSSLITHTMNRHDK